MFEIPFVFLTWSRRNVSFRYLIGYWETRGARSCVPQFLLPVCHSNQGSLPAGSIGLLKSPENRNLLLSRLSKMNYTEWGQAGCSHAPLCPCPAAAVGSMAVSMGAVLALEPLFSVFNVLPLVLLAVFRDFWMICSRKRLVGSNPFKPGSAVASLVLFSARASKCMRWKPSMGIALHLSNLLQSKFLIL